MGCRNDYMEPQHDEVNSRITAQNIRYALEQMGEFVPMDVMNASNNNYGNSSMLNQMVVTLCELCRKMTKDQQDKIIYNGRDAKSRQLAVWWDEHLAADKTREEEEKRVQLKGEINQKLDVYRQQLLDALSADQRALLSE